MSNEENDQLRINPRTGLPFKPSWLKATLTAGETAFHVRKSLREGQLVTVCEEAKCPNIGECWKCGTATFMILGDTCTRGCRFCHVKTGHPNGLIDVEEPHRLAETIQHLNLKFVVLTMVDRDDLSDGGAEHIRQTVVAIQEKNPGVRVEVLAGDFQGREEPLQTVIKSGRGLDVFAHNIETVRRLTPEVRDARASYAQSLLVLKNATRLKENNMYTKSGLMLGLGETAVEIEETLVDLRKVGVDIVTLGQYLQPTPKHFKIDRFAPPEEFEHWKRVAESIGFLAVAAGPLVRSSYKASHLFPE